MPNEAKPVTDPLGSTVFLPQEICRTDQKNEQEVYDDAVAVIEKPAIMVEVSSADQKEFYYFRSIGWQHTLLIISHFANNRWEAYQCIKNPSNKELAGILKRGRQII